MEKAHPRLLDVPLLHSSKKNNLDNLIQHLKHRPLDDLFDDTLRDALLEWLTEVRESVPAVQVFIPPLQNRARQISLPPATTNVTARNARVSACLAHGSAPYLGQKRTISQAPDIGQNVGTLHNLISAMS